jgi:hypothetical protein
VNYFIALARINAPLVEHFVIHTHKEVGSTGSHLDTQLLDSVPSVHAIHMPLEEIARRLEALGICDGFTDGLTLAEVLTKQSSGGYGSKMNDLKATFGGLFAPELAAGAYSHWGWVDLDCMLGDMRPSLSHYLPKFDVITYPDGGLDALFTSGQLTVFRDIEYFRSEFYKGTPATSLICAQGNRLFDEKYTMRHAVRHQGITVVADLYEQVATFDLHHTLVEWTLDKGIVPSSSNAADSSNGDTAGGMLKELQRLQGKHNCVGYWDDSTWVCTPKSIKNFVFKFASGMMQVERVTRKAATAGVRTGGFFHLHQWKTAFVWEVIDYAL